MATLKPTVLIIAGGWHTPQSYNKLSAALQSAGFDVYIPLHPSLNDSRPPNSDLYTDSANIRVYTENLIKDDREIIVLMHSYGGQVGTNALHGLGVKDRTNEKLAGGISNLIYMTAYAVIEGQSMMDMVRHFGHEELMPYAFDFADDKSCVSRDPKTLLIGTDSGVPDTEVDDYLATLQRWNGQCMYQPSTTVRAAWRDIPVTYIHTTKDMTVPLDYQKAFVEGMEKNGVVVQTVSLETGHCPNLTAVDRVANIVLKVSKGEDVSALGVNSAETTTRDVKTSILNVGKAA